jgi:putative hydroxymethylpyrimidine transport system permease protein
MLRKYGLAAGLLLLLLLGWEAACRFLAVPAYILPAPSRIVVALWEWRGPLLGEHLVATLQEVVMGLLLSVLLGVALAGAMHIWPAVYRALYPLLVASQTIPIIAISPVFLFWFGYSLTQRTAVVVLITFFPVAVSLVDGLRSADPDLVAWMRAAGASRWQILWMVEWPSALPAFFSGLKMAATFSVVGAVIGEWLGGQAGLGVFGRRAASSLKSPELFASVLLLSLLGIALFLLVALAERYVLRYRAK